MAADKKELLPYVYAVSSGYSRFLELVCAAAGSVAELEHCLQYATLRQKSITGRTPLFLACCGEELVARMRLAQRILDDPQGLSTLDEPDLAGMSPLWKAVSFNNIALVRLLLEHGADADQTSLMSPLPLAVGRHYNAVVALLIEHGADANVHNYTKAPLQIALHACNAKVIGLLLQAGGEVNVGGEVIAPLIYAVNECCALPVVQQLLKCGADVNDVRGGKGCTPLQLARALHSAEVADLLLGAWRMLLVPLLLRQLLPLYHWCRHCNSCALCSGTAALVASAAPAPLPAALPSGFAHLGAAR